MYGSVIFVAALYVLPYVSTGRIENSINNHKALLPDCENIKEFAPIKAKIQSYHKDVDHIINYTTKGRGKGSTWNELALFCDTFGPRMSGSKSLEDAIDYLEKKMRNESKLKVSKERAKVPNWRMISQSCEIVAPVAKSFRIQTLGYSVSTNGTLIADVEMVKDWSQLERKGQDGKLKDKIVVFNYKFENYPKSVSYRTQGALKASKYGAAAALIKSVTAFSIDSPHAGAGSKSIPTAAITLEDAHLIERWINRNKTVTIKLDLQTEQLEDAVSYNLIGDITGDEKPEEVVFVSGHMDSWYNTAGAMDDGGGMMISYKALDVLKQLNLTASRTMRVILWTAEEPGLIGAKQYFDDHKHELDKFKAVIESDEGTFNPLGLAVKNLGNLGKCAVQEILFLTYRLGTVELSSRYEGSDIELFSDVGVPALSLYNQNGLYFNYHHTSGDTMDLENPAELDRSTALFAATVFILSNLDIDLRS